jgi:uncharacterized linocin/CFP29 family protein
MNHLLRSLAPISDAGWNLLDEEARERLAPALAARKLVDFSGPHGWDYSATNLGRVTNVASAPADGVSGLQRRVLPLVEARADFELSRSELRDADRGADDIDLKTLDKAAHQIAIAENVAVFHGWQGAITGIADASPHDALQLPESADGYPRSVASAVERLLSACAAATSCSSPARTCRSASTRRTPRSCACTSRRVSVSTSPRPRRRWR